jgi:hypothetical protein
MYTPTSIITYLVSCINIEPSMLNGKHSWPRHTHICVGTCPPESEPWATSVLWPLLLKHSYEQEVTLAAVYTHNIYILCCQNSNTCVFIAWKYVMERISSKYSCIYIHLHSECKLSRIERTGWMFWLSKIWSVIRV